MRLANQRRIDRNSPKNRGLIYYPAFDGANVSGPIVDYANGLGTAQSSMGNKSLIGGFSGVESSSYTQKVTTGYFDTAKLSTCTASIFIYTKTYVTYGDDWQSYYSSDALSLRVWPLDLTKLCVIAWRPNGDDYYATFPRPAVNTINHILVSVVNDVVTAIYVNLTPISFTPTYWFHSARNTTTILSFGGGDSGVSAMDFCVYDFKLFNRALSWNEIVGLYCRSNAGIWQKPANSPLYLPSYAAQRRTLSPLGTRTASRQAH